MMRLLLQLVLQLQLILWPLVVLCILSSPAKAVSYAKAGCSDTCGNVTVPYPFGIGSDCYHNKSYEITCNSSHHHPPIRRAFLLLLNLEVLEIVPPYDGSFSEQVIRVNMMPQNICTSDNSDEASSSVDLRGTPYLFSSDNSFVVEGCSGGIVVRNESSIDHEEHLLASCVSSCPADYNNNGTKTEPQCEYGIGCCTASFDNDIAFYKIAAPNTEASAAAVDSHACNTTLVALMAQDYSLNLANGTNNSLHGPVPTILQWIFTDYVRPLPSWENVTCYPESVGRNICGCSSGYEGNPYAPNGCRENCIAYPWACNNKHQLVRLDAVLGISISFGLVLLILGSYWLYRFVKSRREIKQKAKYFKINGGLLLEQHMSSSEGFVEKTKIFSIDELEKATDNFNSNRILGQGGQGTVYKGMLMDGRIVAIKKSEKVDEGQSEQFINEVAILSQVNHRNVVKLLGCCLEAEVPLLVYEFILNGTLYQHIHNPSEEFQVTWKMRLQIAAESAGALTYLHSSSSVPIYHRDIKSTNILLDDKYKAKVSDFGTSRAISIDQTHVTTCVQGTYGYLDPEFFQSQQFTEKSDVYSFGVVLVELITGKKPICRTKDGGWISLAAEFLSQLENSRLFDILDTRVLEEGKEEEFIAVADLARECLSINGKQRPTMKEVAMRLEGIIFPYAASNSTKTNGLERTQVVVDQLSDASSDPVSSVSTFYTDDVPRASFSIDVQPLIPNTL